MKMRTQDISLSVIQYRDQSDAAININKSCCFLLFSVRIIRAWERAAVKHIMTHSLRLLFIISKLVSEELIISYRNRRWLWVRAHWPWLNKYSSINTSYVGLIWETSVCQSNDNQSLQDKPWGDHTICWVTAHSKWLHGFFCSTDRGKLLNSGPHRMKTELHQKQSWKNLRKDDTVSRNICIHMVPLETTENAVVHNPGLCGALTLARIHTKNREDGKLPAGFKLHTV